MDRFIDLFKVDFVKDFLNSDNDKLEKFKPLSHSNIEERLSAISEAISSDIPDIITYSEDRKNKRFSNALLIGLLVFIFIIIILFVLNKVFKVKVF